MKISLQLLRGMTKVFEKAQGKLQIATVSREGVGWFASAIAIKSPMTP